VRPIYVVKSLYLVMQKEVAGVEFMSAIIYLYLCVVSEYAFVKADYTTALLALQTQHLFNSFPFQTSSPW
jgi:hypothetical protein